MKPHPTVGAVLRFGHPKHQIPNPEPETPNPKTLKLRTQPESRPEEPWTTEYRGQLVVNYGPALYPCTDCESLTRGAGGFTGLPGFMGQVGIRLHSISALCFMALGSGSMLKGSVFMVP